MSWRGLDGRPLADSAFAYGTAPAAMALIPCALATSVWFAWIPPPLPPVPGTEACHGNSWGLGKDTAWPLLMG